MSPSRFKAVFLAVVVSSVGIIALTRATTASLPPNSKPTSKIDLNELWLDLEKEELDASRALLKLYDRPKDTVAFLEKKMKPLNIDEEQVKALIDWLGSDKEEIWKPAFEQLEYFDPRLAIDLETLMATVKEPTSRHRMVEVMSGREANQLEDKEIELRGVGDGFNFFAKPNFGSWWAEHKIVRINSFGRNNTKKKWTRAVRAIVLLEHIGTPEAIAILKDMATGHADAQPTNVAKEALKRIGDVAR
jgi:hypothetical protein